MKVLKLVKVICWPNVLKIYIEMDIKPLDISPPLVTIVTHFVTYMH